ncbi:small ribosomal subunit protein uS3mA-like [Saccoglossus kowalevskii]|uniref:28S ribosomal protein S24-A, mitochondrial-like n=1 Tax=Saccoglossus kowalevskii TaxID=10224 RepID=A0ABM0GMD0_SACKO|nr:PREDICTED: 28S ribosomal protein S24-A, mitochondrial-like [Saccoglossus kowalevskii]
MSQCDEKMAATTRMITKRILQLRLSSNPFLRHDHRCLQTSASCYKAGRVKVSKGDKPITYEQANPPHLAGVTKSWKSWNTANLEDEEGAPERAVEDMFIRKFIVGTFHNCLAADTIIKRRANQINICLLLNRNVRPNQYYFLVGYAESLLSHWYKCIVKIEVQAVDDVVIYKWL